MGGEGGLPAHLAASLLRGATPAESEGIASLSAAHTELLGRHRELEGRCNVINRVGEQNERAFVAILRNAQRDRSAREAKLSAAQRESSALSAQLGAALTAAVPSPSELESARAAHALVVADLRQELFAATARATESAEVLQTTIASLEGSTQLAGEAQQQHAALLEKHAALASSHTAALDALNAKHEAAAKKLQRLSRVKHKAMMQATESAAEFEELHTTLEVEHAALQATHAALATMHASIAADADAARVAHAALAMKHEALTLQVEMRSLERGGDGADAEVRLAEEAAAVAAGVAAVEAECAARVGALEGELGAVRDELVALRAAFEEATTTAAATSEAVAAAASESAAGNLAAAAEATARANEAFCERTDALHAAHAGESEALVAEHSAQRVALAQKLAGAEGELAVAFAAHKSRAATVAAQAERIALLEAQLADAAVAQPGANDERDATDSGGGLASFFDDDAEDSTAGGRPTATAAAAPSAGGNAVTASEVQLHAAEAALRSQEVLLREAEAVVDTHAARISVVERELDLARAETDRMALSLASQSSALAASTSELTSLRQARDAARENAVADLADHSAELAAQREKLMEAATLLTDNRAEQDVLVSEKRALQMERTALARDVLQLSESLAAEHAKVDALSGHMDALAPEESKAATGALDEEGVQELAVARHRIEELEALLPGRNAAAEASLLLRRVFGQRSRPKTRLRSKLGAARLEAAVFSDDYAVAAEAQRSHSWRLRGEFDTAGAAALNAEDGGGAALVAVEDRGADQATFARTRVALDPSGDVYRWSRDAGAMELWISRPVGLAVSTARLEREALAADGRACLSVFAITSAAGADAVPTCRGRIAFDAEEKAALWASALTASGYAGHSEALGANVADLTEHLAHSQARRDAWAGRQAERDAATVAHAVALDEAEAEHAVAAEAHVKGQRAHSMAEKTAALSALRIGSAGVMKDDAVRSAAELADKLDRLRCVCVAPRLRRFEAAQCP